MPPTERTNANQSPPWPHVELNGIYYPVDAPDPGASLSSARHAAEDIFEALAVLTNCMPETDPITGEPLASAISR